MAGIFAGSEILEMGIQIEKNGRDFYNEMARRSRNPFVSEVFKFLADEEEKHIAVFEKLSSSIQTYETAGFHPAEYFAYMSALASEYVFIQKDKARQMLGIIKSDKEAVEVGITAEKDSIIFYEGMKKVVPKKDLKIVNELIAQEQDHLRQFVELKGRI